MGYFANAAAILIEVLFGLLAGLFALRVLLQVVRANFYNPICQVVYRLTNPVLMPIRRVIKPVGSFDTAGALAVWIIECLKVVFLALLAGFAPRIPGLLVLGLAETAQLVLWLYFWAILIRVILGFADGGHHPVVPLIYQITEPVLQPLRRLLPARGGIDFSPLLAALGILLARALIAAPLADWGMYLARAVK